MAENPQGDQGTTAAAVQMPRELPSIYWRPRVAISGKGRSLWGMSLLFKPEPLDHPELVIGERSNVHRVRGTGPVHRFLAAPPQPSFRGSVVTSSECMSDQVGFDIVPMTYRRLNADQRDTADILTLLFSKNNLAPNGNGRINMTFARFRNLLQLPQAGVAPTTSGPSSGLAPTLPIVSTAENRATPERGSSSDMGMALD
ncbi:hypothetical protein PIB30_004005 [Stylosanthes scabra]|uniref:Uncharacterized protein n=1 Tax=Stylosanthes scabra TaxID=79078 RepID=A0ABU6X1G2_9FABA|nr:hypothetical protein [Stylosanthes scabra]